MLAAALRDRLAQCPPERRPKVVLFGESLGAWTSQDAFVGSGTQGLVDAGIDFADLDRHAALQQVEGTRAVTTIAPTSTGA